MANRHSKLFRLASKLEMIGERALASVKLLELFGKDYSKIQAGVRTLVPQLTDAVLAQFALEELIDPEAAEVFMGHFPHGSSVRQIIHYGQNINAKQFALYDYHDKKKNMEAYGQEKPPAIDLNQIT